MGILFTILMGIPFTITMGFLFTIVLGIQLTISIWVRESDFSIMKIEWIQTALGGFEGVEKTVEGFDVRPLITYISEYTHEKKGIRFPNKYFIKETYIGPNQERFLRSETTISYEDYKFFTVETEDKH
ncbi:MAG: hypothetical protein WBC20_06885 [Candidatus Aminicenantaceae bacterium]